MSYFIIIRGPLGCGKTTIMKRLANILKADYISIDKVLEKHKLDKIDKKRNYIHAHNFIKANKMVLAETKKKLSKGKIVIFDGCFYHKEQIEHLIENLHYDNYIFTLKAPLELCIERDSKRKKFYGKSSAKTVYKLVSKLDYGISIDATKNLDEIIKDILLHLPKVIK